MLTPQQIQQVEGLLAGMDAADIHQLCHNLEKTVSAEQFAQGCEDYQQKLFGRCPTRDRIAALRTALRYYADAAKYINGEYGYQLIMPIELDKGEIARQALAKDSRVRVT